MLIVAVDSMIVLECCACHQCLHLYVVDYYSGTSPRRTGGHYKDLASFQGLIPPFLPLVYVHKNTWEQKTSENWVRPGSIYHVSEHAMDIGKEVQYSNMDALNFKTSFFTGQEE